MSNVARRINGRCATRGRSRGEGVESWPGAWHVPRGDALEREGPAVAKTGTARLAIEANCPILPMAVTGLDRFFKRFPRRTLVQIKILPPLMPRPGENPLALTDRLMFNLAQALPEEMRGVYAESPEGFEMRE